MPVFTSEIEEILKMSCTVMLSERYVPWTAFAVLKDAVARVADC